MKRPLQSGIETAHRDLYRSMRRMQLTVWFALVYGTLGFFTAIYLYLKTSSEKTPAENTPLTTYINATKKTDLWLGDYRKENEAILKDHIETFMKYYFSYNPKTRIERQQKAVVLLDPTDAETLEKIYVDWHGQVENYGLVQDISNIEIEILPGNEPWHFEATSHITLSGIGTGPTRYILECRGYVLQVPANKLNKNGLIITSLNSNIKDDKR